MDEQKRDGGHGSSAGHVLSDAGWREADPEHVRELLDSRFPENLANGRKYCWRQASSLTAGSMPG